MILPPASSAPHPPKQRFAPRLSAQLSPSDTVGSPCALAEHLPSMLRCTGTQPPSGWISYPQRQEVFMRAFFGIPLSDDRSRTAAGIDAARLRAAIDVMRPKPSPYPMLRIGGDAKRSQVSFSTGQFAVRADHAASSEAPAPMLKTPLRVSMLRNSATSPR